MAWMQPLSRGATLVARLVRSAPSGTAARWSIHAIVLNSDSYAWLIDRLATCVADDDFWNHSAFTSGEAVELPPWEPSTPLPPSNRTQLRTAIARIKEEGIARVDRSEGCEPWDFVVRAPSSLRGDDRVRLRWLVGFDHFPRGSHIVSGRFASAVGQVKARTPIAAPEKDKPRGTTPVSDPTVAQPCEPDYDEFPTWKAKMDRPDWTRLLVPTACVVVMIGVVVLAIVRIRTGGVA